ncbi:conserved hypothetical protein [Parafrankia sp. Ea1.12]|nr:conserved hypothetical protein [Parafrankia sp. Ea1.12]
MLHADTGWPGVWRELVGGIRKGMPVASPSASSMAASRRRLGVAPLRGLFEAVRGAVAAGWTGSVWWHGRLVCALDGTQVVVPDTDENKTVYRKGGGNHGGTGYPLVRLVVLIACGTRGVIDAVFAPTSDGEPTCATRLLSSLRAGMIVLADRNVGGQPLLEKIAATEADPLVRVTNNRLFPVGETYRDGSWRSRAGRLDVRVIRCEITITTDAGRKTGYYLLVSTLLDPAIPATDLVRLYHNWWLIEIDHSQCI